MRRGRKQTAPLLSTHLHCLCCTSHRSPHGTGSPRPCRLHQVRVLCLSLRAAGPQGPEHPPRPVPMASASKDGASSPESRAMWQRAQTLARNSSNLRAADCCSAINTTRAINKHYLSALVFLMLGHSALACGATRRLKAGFRDESKLA